MKVLWCREVLDIAHENVRYNRMTPGEALDNAITTVMRRAAQGWYELEEDADGRVNRDSVD